MTYVDRNGPVRISKYLGPRTYQMEESNTFKKYLKALKQYHMGTYKHLIFKLYPKMKNGEFPGERVNITGDWVTYRVELPVDNEFKLMYGKMLMTYMINVQFYSISKMEMTPADVLLAEHSALLNVVNGVPVKNELSDKDKFKLELIARMGR